MATANATRPNKGRVERRRQLDAVMSNTRLASRVLKGKRRPAPARWEPTERGSFSGESEITAGLNLLADGRGYCAHIWPLNGDGDGRRLWPPFAEDDARALPIGSLPRPGRTDRDTVPALETQARRNKLRTVCCPYSFRV
jgi:hypothetical protein